MCRRLSPNCFALLACPPHSSRNCRLDWIWPSPGKRKQRPDRKGIRRRAGRENDCHCTAPPMARHKEVSPSTGARFRQSQELEKALAWTQTSPLHTNSNHTNGKGFSRGLNHILDRASSPSGRPRGCHSRGLPEERKKSSCAGEPSMRLRESQKAMVHAIRVDGKSRDHTPEVDAQG